MSIALRLYHNSYIKISIDFSLNLSAKRLNFMCADFYCPLLHCTTAASKSIDCIIHISSHCLNWSENRFEQDLQILLNSEGRIADRGHFPVHWEH